jgi:hypothetical protein
VNEQVHGFETGSSPPERTEKLNLRAFSFTSADHAGLAALADPKIVARLQEAIV